MRRKSRDSEQLRLLLPESSDIQNLTQENRRLQIENERLQIQNERLQRENAALIEEIARLRQSVSQESESTYLETGLNRSPTEVPTGVQSSVSTRVTKKSTISEKVRLFRSYFKGRDDVYAVRGKEREGKAPYYPKRQRIPTSSGELVWGDTIPLTDDVIRAHLHEEKHPVIVGLYPLLLDETCWFLAIDFDKSTWKEDSGAFLETCQELSVPVALERSRSGNGGHVWIFFEEPIPARIARSLGAALLTWTLGKRHQIGLDSYDRMFPNQDTLPKNKKLGNLIALPLQRLAGKDGSSLFIDPEGIHISISGCTCPRFGK